MPAALVEVIDASDSLIDAFVLRTLWRESEGRPLRGGSKIERITAEYGFDAADVDRLVHVYNTSLASRPSGRSLHHNSARRLAAQLSNLTGVLPTAIAERFPTRVDRRQTGPLHYRDVYGDVYSSTTLRPQHIGFIAHVCGIFTNSDIYSPLGYIDGRDRVRTSERKLYFSTIAAGEPGGDGIAAIRRLLVDLAAAELIANQSDPPKRSDPHVTGGGGYVRPVGRDPDGALCFDGHFDDTRLERSRDRSLPGNPFAAIRRLVVDEREGSVWADVADPRPTDTSAEFTIEFELAPWLIERLDDVRGRVFVAMNAWRALSPFQARLLVYLQSQRAKTTFHEGRRFTGFAFFASGPLCRQLGLTASHRYAEIRDSLFAALCEIQRSTNRYEWISPPYRRFLHMNAYSFSVRVAPGGSSKLVYRTAGARLTKRWLREKQNRLRLLAYASDLERGHSPPPLRI